MNRDLNNKSCEGSSLFLAEWFARGGLLPQFRVTRVALLRRRIEN